MWLGGNQNADVDFWFRPSNWKCDGVGTFVPWDLNGDHIADLAIGAPGEDVASKADAGLVHVLYGDESGPSTTDDEQWHQDTPNVEGPAEVGDRFGEALASGDFDGDGYGDLAVGAPLDGVGSIAKAGVVNVIYGARSGLNGGDTQLWQQDSSSINGVAQGG